MELPEEKWRFGVFRAYAPLPLRPKPDEGSLPQLAMGPPRPMKGFRVFRVKGLGFRV